VVAFVVIFCVESALSRDAPKDSSIQNCEGFGRSLTRERDWFADKGLPRRSSGARLRRIDRAVDLELRPTPKVSFFLPPLRPPKADSYSGEVTFFGVPKPGPYRVTLSEDASIDVFENGARLKPTASARMENCSGVASTARFDLAPGDLVLVEVTGAKHDTIKVAFDGAP
jgi:hypothetical protein